MDREVIPDQKFPIHLSQKWLYREKTKKHIKNIPD